jgi:hypothetical protein
MWNTMLESSGLPHISISCTLTSVCRACSISIYDLQRKEKLIWCGTYEASCTLTFQLRIILLILLITNHPKLFLSHFHASWPPYPASLCIAFSHTHTDGMRVKRTLNWCHVFFEGHFACYEIKVNEHIICDDWSGMLLWYSHSSCYEEF